jgi:gamma-glutamyltranspeptidase/glutathione hydrolase
MQGSMVRRVVVVLAAAVAGALGATPAVAAPSCDQRSDAARSAAVSGRSLMVAAAHPDAAAAGCEVLRRGGNAVDAAVAVQAVLAVVEPQSSGFGGGTLITHLDRKRARVEHYEGLASAPGEVTDGLRTPTASERAELGVDEFESEVAATGRAVGVPGTVAVLEQAHERAGRLPWKRLFDRAIRLAEDGFAMPPYLHEVMSDSTFGLSRCRYPDLRARYCDGDAPKPVGTLVLNRELADVLRELRRGGADAFYDPEGTIAPAVVARAAAGPHKLVTDAAGPAVIPSLMTVEDVERYEPVRRDPICRERLGRELCTAPPPSFGGVTVLQQLGLMERGGVAHMAPLTPERVHLAIEASRLANFDRREYVGDPDFHDVPVAGLLDEGYLDERFALFSPERAIQRVEPGNPPGADEDMTSHVSIVDRGGDAVSMTTTVNSSFGAQMEARGMVLNNVQENFTRLDSISPGKPANVMEPYKRPRTSIAPSLAFDGRGSLRLVVGAAGGSGIPDYISQTFLGVTVDGMDPQTAIGQGHWSGQAIATNCGGAIGPYSELERGSAAAALLPALQEREHPCPRLAELRSGLTAIEVGPNGRLLGAADPRRDGAAVGG